MKFALVLVALLGCANASLKDDVYEFWGLIPWDQIKDTTQTYLANDEEFAIIINWLKTDGVTIGRAIGEHPTWQVLVDFLESKDLDVSIIVDKARAALGLSTRDAVAYASRPDYFANRSFHGWVAEIRALIPVDELRALYVEKKANSSDFQELLALLTSEPFQTLVQDIAGLEEVQNLLESGRNHGIDVDSVLDFVAGILGWSRS